MTVVAQPPLREEFMRFLSRDELALENRYALYARLRDEAPTFVYDANSAIITRYADVKAAYSDFARFPSPPLWDTPFEGRFDLLSADELEQYRIWMGYENTRLTQLDGEQHRRVRSAAQRMFSPKRVAGMRGTIEGFVERLLDDLEEDPSHDFIANVAFPLPLLVVLHLIGVPEEDGPLLKRWCDTILEPLGERQLRPEAVRDAYRASIAFRDYVRELIAEQRSSADRTTLVTALFEATAEDRLVEDELISMYQVLLFAGHETTTNLFGNGLFELLKHRDQWELLMDDRSLVASAIEELLRYDTPVHFIRRAVVEDQKVGDTTIPAGATVLLCNAAANRDPRAYEEPDVLDVTRQPQNPHISFGHGIHFCLGSSIARMEADAGFRALLRRYPNLDIGVPVDEVRYKPHWWHRALHSLPLDLGA